MSSSATVPVRNSSLIARLADINSSVNKEHAVGKDVNGIYASAFPMMTPKYARHAEAGAATSLETMARMFVPVPTDMYDSFIASLPDEETKAIAKVLTGDNGQKGGKGYFDFLLQTADHTLTEKVQVVETLEDNYVAYFFGTAPPIWSYSGILMNTYQDDWVMRMFRMYQQLIRGTSLAKRKLVLQLKYDSMLVTGAVLNLSWRLVGGIETYCVFQFTLLVKSVDIIYGGLYNPTTLVDSGAFLDPATAASLVPIQVTEVSTSGVPVGVAQKDFSDALSATWRKAVETVEKAANSVSDATGTSVDIPEEVPPSLGTTGADTVVGRIPEQKSSTNKSSANTVKGRVNPGTNEVVGIVPISNINP